MTGRIWRALQGYAITCCWCGRTMTRATAQPNPPIIRWRPIPEGINCLGTPSKTRVTSGVSWCARKQAAAFEIEGQQAKSQLAVYTIRRMSDKRGRWPLSRCRPMNAERWASFLKGDQSDYLGARTVAHGSTFLAV